MFSTSSPCLWLFFLSGFFSLTQPLKKKLLETRKCLFFTSNIKNIVKATIISSVKTSLINDLIYSSACLQSLLCMHKEQLRKCKYDLDYLGPLAMVHTSDFPIPWIQALKTGKSTSLEELLKRAQKKGSLWEKLSYKFTTFPIFLFSTHSPGSFISLC